MGRRRDGRSEIAGDRPLHRQATAVEHAGLAVSASVVSWLQPNQRSPAGFTAQP